MSKFDYRNLLGPVKGSLDNLPQLTNVTRHHLTAVHRAKLRGCQPVRSPHFMEPECLLLYQWKPATCTYPDPYESSLRPPLLQDVPLETGPLAPRNQERICDNTRTKMYRFTGISIPTSSVTVCAFSLPKSQTKNILCLFRPARMPVLSGTHCICLRFVKNFISKAKQYCTRDNPRVCERL